MRPRARHPILPSVPARTDDVPEHHLPRLRPPVLPVLTPWAGAFHPDEWASYLPINPTPKEPLMNLSLIAREPVRVYLYGVVGTIVAALIVYGIVDVGQAAVWLGIAAAVLSVPVVETARSKVIPVAKVAAGVADVTSFPEDDHGAV